MPLGVTASTYVISRGSQVDVLQERGVQLETNGSLSAHDIAVRPELPEGEEFDCALLAVGSTGIRKWRDSRISRI